MMIDKVGATIERYRMLHNGCPVTAAVSGGADSIAMLHILHRMSAYPLPGGPRFSLSAAHLNHGIRGQEADRDEAFVRSICQSWGIPLTVERANIPALCRHTGEGIEECARRVRYDFLRRCAGDGRIATAHTQTDNVETFLMHMLRGSALRGLGGIPPVRDNIVRPLLDCSREEIERYCLQERLSYVTDSTNLLDDCLRNRIRHRLLPLLEDLEPGAVRQIGRMMAHLRQDEDCLCALSKQICIELGDQSLHRTLASPSLLPHSCEEIPLVNASVTENACVIGDADLAVHTKDHTSVVNQPQFIDDTTVIQAGDARPFLVDLSAIGQQDRKTGSDANGGVRAGDGALSAASLLTLPRALRSRILLFFAQNHSAGRIESRHVDALEELLSGGGAYTLPGEVRIVCRDGMLLAENIPPADQSQDWKFPLIEGDMSLPIGRYEFTLLSNIPADGKPKIYNLLLNQCIDYGKIAGKVVVRNRRPGDHIALPGRPRKSLKKLFNESHLPLFERRSRLILADEAGVLFVEGFGPDQRCAPGCHTQRLLRIEKREDAHA